jgi:cytoskeletal protein RodZ
VDNLGQYLRALREERQLTPDAVKADIKLSTEQITAIENNHLSRLGELGVARAIVYTYVRYLNADEKRAMYLFDQILPPHNKPGFTPKKPLREKKVLISTNFIWMVTIFLIVVFLGSIIWISYSKGYLKRPFERSQAFGDTLNTPLKAAHFPDKPDTLRNRMLQLTSNAQKNSDQKAIVKQKPTRKSKDALSDSTDYLDGLLFKSKDSPFNSRF